ncbi:MAG: alpha/beta fold hydrolase [Myxococcales bacterium]|nr:alpha/beta fold hydrolase [Myxococcales bacterium]
MKRAIVALAVALGSTGCLAFHAGPLPGAPDKAQYAEVEGVRIRYEDKGEGPAVVLVHGFASALESWATVTPVLVGKHRVLSLDLKGFGWSGRPEGDYSPPAQAKIVLALMKARGIEKADVVAHSWGSSVALQVALAAPERVNKLALYDAWVYEEQLPTFFLWARADGVGEALFGLYYKERADERMAYAFYDKERFMTEHLVEDVDRALERPGTVAAALAAVRGQNFAKWQDQYKKIQQSTLLLWGREDAVTLLSFGERLHKDLPNSKLVVYPQCGHFPMLEAVKASNADLVSFLDGN